jgi:serine/threonine protein kinase
MREVFETDDSVFLILEYMKGGELTGRILSATPFPESEVKFIFYQIMLGVRYLHANGVTHRDLKVNIKKISTNVTIILVVVAGKCVAPFRWFISSCQNFGLWIKQNYGKY